MNREQMTSTANHITEALTKVEAVRRELETAGAKPARINLATKVYNVLVDMQSFSQPADSADLLEEITAYLAGGREALDMNGNRPDVLWDTLEATLAPLCHHMAYVQAYGD